MLRLLSPRILHGQRVLIQNGRSPALHAGLLPQSGNSRNNVTTRDAESSSARLVGTTYLAIVSQPSAGTYLRPGSAMMTSACRAQRRNQGIIWFVIGAS